MIRNGVINAQREFAERRYIAETDRHFAKIKADVISQHGLDIECCREVWRKAQGKIFAVLEDMLVNTYADPMVVENWEEHKKRNGI